MAESSPGEVTSLLLAWRRGDQAALDRLMPLVYSELHAIAGRHLRGERPEHTLQPTALIHEAYLRLVGTDVEWEGRTHFLAVAARTMRRILVDHARARARRKRDPAQAPLALDEPAAVGSEPSGQLLALDEALERLSALDERKARAIELHYFGGLTYDEAAQALGISRATLHRELRVARAWLYRELSQEPGAPASAT
jgi:RNA polymerase sigma factor (TIGR02999 family)